MCPEGGWCEGSDILPVADDGWWEESDEGVWRALPCSFVRRVPGCCSVGVGLLWPFATWLLISTSFPYPTFLAFVGWVYVYGKCFPASICLRGNVCADGHTGDACAACIDNYYQEEGICKECPKGTPVCVCVRACACVCVGVVAFNVAANIGREANCLPLWQ